MEQTKERSKIRLLGNREKPIDLIAKNILLIDAAANVDKRDNDTEYTTAKNVSLLELDVEIRNPLSIVGELPPADLAVLVDDISGYLQLEQLDGRGQYAAFWEALREVAAADLRCLRAGAGAGTGAGADGPRRSVHSAVEKDVQQLLQGKDRPQLDDMEADIEKSIAQGKTRDLVRDSSECVSCDLTCSMICVCVAGVLGAPSVRGQGAALSLCGDGHAHLAAAEAAAGAVHPAGRAAQTGAAQAQPA